MTVKTFFKDIDQSKIKKDLIWNYISLVFLGLSGIGINIIIGINYEPAILGSFNQVLVTYLITSIIYNSNLPYKYLTIVKKKLIFS